MAKTTGMAQTALSVDDSAGSAKDIRNDITDWQMATPRAAQDITGVDKSAMERLLLLADFSITLNGDMLEEPNETFYLNLISVTNGILLDDQGLATIIDDDFDI